MVRSTIWMARSTPAQNPRGLASRMASAGRAFAAPASAAKSCGIIASSLQSLTSPAPTYSQPGARRKPCFSIIFLNETRNDRDQSRQADRGAESPLWNRGRGGQDLLLVRLRAQQVAAVL